MGVRDATHPGHRFSVRFILTAVLFLILDVEVVFVIAWALGLLGLATFVLCIVYGLIVPQSLHMADWLEQMLPGFTWLTLPGFLIGAPLSHSCTGSTRAEYMG